jgi:RNA polymerase sigma-70 factor, ECF subfamily
MGHRRSTLRDMSERRRPTFDEALAAARQGAPWALGWLYRRFQPGLLRMLAVIAPHQAEDLASDVWLEVAGTVCRFDGDEPAFRTWLATTARRRVIKASRARGRRSERSVEDDEQDAAAAFAAQVVAVLSPDQADVVLLRVVEGLDVEAVARALGKQPGAVRSLQQRALRRLALQLEPGALSA